MRVYVASKFENRDAARAAHTLLRLAGHEVTFDWTDEGEAGRTRRVSAWLDFAGARAAHVTIVLADYDPAFGPMRGALIEAGVTLAAGGLVFYVSRTPVGTIFDALPVWRYFDSVEEAVAAIAAVPR